MHGCWHAQCSIVRLSSSNMAVHGERGSGCDGRWLHHGEQPQRICWPPPAAAAAGRTLGGLTGHFPCSVPSWMSRHMQSVDISCWVGQVPPSGAMWQVLQAPGVARPQQQHAGVVCVGIVRIAAHPGAFRSTPNM